MRHHRDKLPTSLRFMDSVLVWLAAVCICVGFAVLVPHSAYAASSPQITEAQAAIVTDADGNILWESDAYDEMPMASTTKIMTAMVVLDSGISMDKVVTVTETNLSIWSQLAGFEAGSTTTVGDLMQVLLVYSANDAAVLLARAVSGNEAAFVTAMNEKASELGLKHTHFANSHGLEEDDHYSCAADLVVMGRYAIENYPEIAELVCQESCTITINGTEKTYESTDELLETYVGAAGIKTGKTEFGCAFLGYCSRYDIGLYSAVLGCPTSEGRFVDTAVLWNWAYGTVYTHTLANSAQTVFVMPYALRFGYYVTVSYDEDVSGTYDTSVGEVSWRRTHASTHLLVDTSSPLGVTIWNQGERVLGIGTLSSSPEAYILPAFGRYSTWLFVDEKR